MQPIYDLHCHSTASDGSLSPTALVEKAIVQNVHTLALTDHDVTAGLAEAAAAAGQGGLNFVPGIEISVSWRSQTIHIVGLRIDAGDSQLQSGLSRLREFRDWRGEEIGRRLAKAGIPDAHAGARALAEGAILSRTHFARFLVEQGYAKDMREVFKRFLVRNKPGHVPGDWATLQEAVEWINGAGGQAVIAHPARYKLTGSKLRGLIREFKEAGGVGLEVVSGTHTKDEVQTMAGLANKYGLLASTGSDYHGANNVYLELGRIPPLPLGCTPIWTDSLWTAVKSA